MFDVANPDAMAQATICESKGDKFYSSAESRIRNRVAWTESPIQKTERLLQTDWAIEDQAKNLNSIAQPSDQRAFRIELTYQLSNFSFSRNVHVLLS